MPTPKPTEAQVWSSGGGVQSTAIGCLIVRGELPVPDYAVIADTGREASTTWDYLFRHANAHFEQKGFQVEVAPHDLATVDLFSHSGKLLIPAYTTPEGGTTGQLPTYCSNEWKRRVVLRWLRARGVKSCEMWIGISVDEASRMKDSDVGWVKHRYPLIDLGIDRAMAAQIVREAGLPEPPRSSCWMCPYRTPAEWDALTPEDAAKAAALEVEIQKYDPTLTLRSPKATKEMACDQLGFCWV